VGVGLPSTIAGSPSDLLLPWARRAEAGRFASLGAHDRLAYDSLEPLTALAAAAAVTRRPRLAALVVVAPLRNPAVLAKSAASLHALSGGRFTLGLGVGPRRDDYLAAGVDFAARGRVFEEQLRRLQEVRSAGVEVLLGGGSDRSLVRMVRFADGFCHAGGPPRSFRGAADRVRIAWSDAARPGRPRLWGMGYFGLGGAAEAGREELRRYYGFTGAFAERIAAGLLTDAAAVREFCSGYEAAGCDELVLFPTVARLDQVDLLAEAVAGR